MAGALSRQKQVAVIAGPAEGNSIRSIERMTVQAYNLSQRTAEGIQ